MILYFLPMILFLGVITSYEDLKFGKIRNKWIILALAYTFIVNVLLFIYYGFNGGLNTQYYLELLTNLIFSIIIGFGFWYYGVWSAGDGKLFIAFASLIPLSTYTLTYYKWVPSLTLLINIFQISLIFMIFLMIKNFKKTDITIKELIKEIFNLKRLRISILSLFTIYWIIKLIIAVVGITSPLLTLIITFLTIPYFQKVLGKQMNLMMVLIMILRLIFDTSIYSMDFLKNFLLITLLWHFIRMFFQGALKKLSMETFTKKMSFNKIKEGMILSEFIEKKKLSKKEVNDLKKEKDMDIIKKGDYYYIKRLKGFFNQNNYIDEESEGITKEQLKEIKNIGFKDVRVSKAMPFAILIFIGVLITILVKGNLLILIKNLF
jgi:hypothetical protein